MSLLYECVRRLIELVYGVCGDYGIAIVLITIAVRLSLLPLGRKQRQAMKKQQQLGQKIEEIKKKYGNNTSKMNAELGKLYQREGTGSMGCLLSLLQFPIMLVLFNGIRLAATANVTTVLLPWVPSLLVRDSSYILPVLTVAVQMIPQMLPYIGFFKKLNMQKMSAAMILILLFTNSWFAFMLPSGIELYYLVSGLFTSIEQVVNGIIEIKNMEIA